MPFPAGKSNVCSFAAWEAWVRFEVEGAHTFRVEGWSDPWGTWLHNAEAKLPAGVDIELVCMEGRDLFADPSRPAVVACRIYPGGPLPSLRELRRALKEAAAALAPR